MTRLIPRRTGLSAAATPTTWSRRSGLDDSMRPAQILDDLLAQGQRRPAVEVAGHGGSGEKRPERRQVAPEALEQPVAQLLAGGRAERGGEATADAKRVDALALGPGLDEGEPALHAIARHRPPVHLVQLGDELDLDGDDSHGF